jgi:hypothetical protein
MSSLSLYLLYIVFAAGTGFSLMALFWGRRLKREGYRIPSTVSSDPAFQEVLGGGCATGGELEFQAPAPAKVLELLALHLENPMHSLYAGLAFAGLTPTTVLHRDAESLRFGGADPWSPEGLVRVERGSAPDRWLARWVVRVPRAGKLIFWGQAWALGLALPASVAAPAVIFYWVLGNPNPAIAGQALQVLQVANVVWEPYLFIGLGAQRIKLAGHHIRTMLSAAVYEVRTGRQTWPGPPQAGR